MTPTKNARGDKTAIEVFIAGIHRGGKPESGDNWLAVSRSGIRTCNETIRFRVDLLRLWLHGPIVDDAYGEEEAEFDVPEIRTLAGWPLLDRLTVLNLCAPLSPDTESLIAGGLVIGDLASAIRLPRRNRELP